jgi:hypothetical protein
MKSSTAVVVELVTVLSRVSGADKTGETRPNHRPLKKEGVRCRSCSGTAAQQTAPGAASEVPVTSRPLRPVTPHDLTYPDYTTLFASRKKILRKFPIFPNMPNGNRMTVMCELNSHGGKFPPTSREWSGPSPP